MGPSPWEGKAAKRWAGGNLCPLFQEEEEGMFLPGDELAPKMPAGPFFGREPGRQDTSSGYCSVVGKRDPKDKILFFVQRTISACELVVVEG